MSELVTKLLPEYPLSAAAPAGTRVRGRRRVRALTAFLVLGLCLGLCIGGAVALGFAVARFRLRALPNSPVVMLPQISQTKNGIQVRVAQGVLLGEVGVYRDQLTAYLRYQFLRSLPAFDGKALMIRAAPAAGATEYRLYAGLPNDWMAGNQELARLQIGHLIPGFDVSVKPLSQVQGWEQQTLRFESDLNGRAPDDLLQVPREQLTEAVARFILFKVNTDRRVIERRLSPAKILSPDQAVQMAADIIDVARFYKLPVDMLLGVGAMENNYIDVRGDIEHSVWKPFAEPGDLVLQRANGRVLVSNFSSGPWQITRETLRHAHALFRRDKRDYRKLPARLRPRRTLSLNHVPPAVLTTYAGLLLRELLDTFHGDRAKAEGAYNGTVAQPNMRYAEGVSMVADYARRVLSLTAKQGGVVSEMAPAGAVSEPSQAMEAAF